ncbi:hypothetical protein M0G74_10530 [Microbulbifer sp. CAU 1566]|uniref:hypothetical protein n=1 Tax=Microbulbifer sp. CAU 1566 TaxID=2933269 RepID=UPI0020030337|nr:hypothetical protein [Microbulbifer sp. CAU 1566]MCK7597704.1 hypothetical protein [Microbulbifer sp. CAU 1566]
MEWPSNEECLEAMTKITEYYMTGEQKVFWQELIKECEDTGRFPPGKGFLHDINKVTKASDKPDMPDFSELYQLICTVCI